MLLNLPLRSRRHLLLIRQRARQIAAMLQFQPQDQMCIAAGAFTVAVRALRRYGPGCLCIQIDKESLQVFPKAHRQDSAALRLVKRLPALAPDIAVEDMGWLLEQLNRQTSNRVFDEIERQNQEMLSLLHALQTAQNKIERLERGKSTPIAA
jgi:hypothetical protein